MADWILVMTMATAGAFGSVPPGIDREDALYCTDAGPIWFEGLLSLRPEARYRIIVPGKNIPGTMELEWREAHLAGTWADADGEGPILIVFHEQLKRLTALYAGADPIGWEEVWQGTLATTDTCE